MRVGAGGTSPQKGVRRLPSGARGGLPRASEGLGAETGFDISNWVEMKTKQRVIVRDASTFPEIQGLASGKSFLSEQSCTRSRVRWGCFPVTAAEVR